LLEMSARKPHPQFTSRARPHLQVSQMICLEAWHPEQCSAAEKHLQCCLCSAKNKYQCSKCKVSLHSPTFCNLPHNGKFLRVPTQHGEVTILRQVKCCIFDINTTLFHFWNL
jgi:hypothetical protein